MYIVQFIDRVCMLKNLALFDRVEDDILWNIGANISKYIGDDMVLFHKWDSLTCAI